MLSPQDKAEAANMIVSVLQWRKQEQVLDLDYSKVTEPKLQSIYFRVSHELPKGLSIASKLLIKRGSYRVGKHFNIKAKPLPFKSSRHVSPPPRQAEFVAESS